MANYVQNYTDRIFARYQTHESVHTFFLRTGVSGSPDYAVDTMELFLDMLTPLVDAWGPTDFEILDFRFQAANTDYSVPVTLADTALMTGFTGDTAPSKVAGATQCRFEARSGSGAPFNLSIFGLNDPAAYDDASAFRVLASESATLALFLTRLQTLSRLTAVDGATLHWKRYANIAENAYWRRKLRG